ncbi:MAG: hypothetical protein IT452_24515, partial [Planctomycetia bacterium]|nr:hypothetical protein [Planctomycetia bacterium]
MDARRVRLLCALTLLVLLCGLGSGCRGKRSRTTTVVQGGGVFTTDEFPGDPVQNGNVADDLRAMSPSGDAYNGQLRVVHNGDRGDAIVVYRGATGFAYAHHFDGESWTPPVQLVAVDADLGSVQAGQACIAFLNTAEHPSETARERDGDAVIVWQAVDVGSGGGDGENTCLYSTYFNVTGREDAGANYGFQFLSDRISTLEDGEIPPFSEDANIFGLVSDGLCGEARWSDGGSSYAWGDSTTGLAVFWLQFEDNDTVTAGMQQDRYLAAATWNLDQSGDPELPLVPGSDFRVSALGFGASDSGMQSEETHVETEFVSYNNTVFFRLSSRADAGSLAGYTPVSAPFWGSLSAGVDVTIQALTFDLLAGSVEAVVALGLSTQDSTVGDMIQSNAAFTDHGGMFGGGFLSSRHSVYGSDEGLARTAIFTLSLEADDDATFGEIVADGRLLLSELDPATGAVADAALIDGEDADFSDSVTTDFSSRISRNGDYVWAAWFEPVDMSPTGPSADDHFGIWAGQYLPPRLDDDGSVPASIPPLFERTHAAVRLSPDVTGGFSAGSGFAFQQGLGYVCGVQSDPDVMNLFFEHSDASQDAYHMARLTADLDPAGGISPGIAVSPFESFPEGTFGFLIFSDDTPYGFIAADSGEGGNVVA